MQPENVRVGQSKACPSSNFRPGTGKAFWPQLTQKKSGSAKSVFQIGPHSGLIDTLSNAAEH